MQFVVCFDTRSRMLRILLEQKLCKCLLSITVVSRLRFIVKEPYSIFEKILKYLLLCPMHTGYDQMHFPPLICRMSTSSEPHHMSLYVPARRVSVASCFALLCAQVKSFRAHWSHCVVQDAVVRGFILITLDSAGLIALVVLGMNTALCYNMFRGLIYKVSLSCFCTWCNPLTVWCFSKLIYLKLHSLQRGLNHSYTIFIF